MNIKHIRPAILQIIGEPIYGLETTLYIKIEGVMTLDEYIKTFHREHYDRWDGRDFQVDTPKTREDVSEINIRLYNNDGTTIALALPLRDKS